MAPRASGPEPAEWLAAAFRGVHPVRWALALSALAVTGVVAAGVQALVARQALDLAGWWQDPVTQVRELGSQMAERSTLGLIVRLGAALAVVGMTWSLAGAWIARNELLARLRGRPDLPYTTPSLGPTGLVAGKFKQLMVCGPIVIILASLMLMPLVVATWINMIPGLGPTIVGILLPVVLVADLFFLLLVVGMLSWPLMPVTIAAENTDTFDALSRSYNYLYAKPIRFLFLLVMSLALSAVPFVAVLYALDGPFAGWPATTRQAVLFVAAGLSASVFWSLQPLVYLHLRAAVDDTDSRQIAGSEGPAASIEEEPIASVPEKSQLPGESEAAPRFGPLGLLVALLLLVTTAWFFTAWLFMRSGGEDAQWIGWGWFDGFVPPAPGIKGMAALLALVWGALWLLLPFVGAVRGYGARSASDEKSADKTKAPAQPIG
jgi:hypothetical protein